MGHYSSLPVDERYGALPVDGGYTALPVDGDSALPTDVFSSAWASPQGGRRVDKVRQPFDEGPMAPVPLHRNYQIEKTFGSHIMADYLEILLAKYGRDMDQIPQLQAVNELFKEEKVKGTPRGLARPDDARVQELFQWGDSLFASLSSWPKPGGKSRKEQIFRILNSLRMGVKYCTQQAEREKFKITLGPELMRGEQLFDTEKLMALYAAKKNYLLYGVIWVLGPDNEFYSHVAKLGRIHHSSFFGGEAILAGGDWTVEAGKLKKISGQSGHYKPGIGCLIGALRKLAEHSVVGRTDNVAMVWDAASYGGQAKQVSLNELESSPNSYRAYG